MTALAKTNEEVLEEIESLIEIEKETIRDHRKNGEINTVGAGMSIGALDVLMNLKEFILG